MDIKNVTPFGLHLFAIWYLICGQFRAVLCGTTQFYPTSPCPNYSLWKRAISADSAVLKSSGEFHGDCTITFQVPYPDRQQFLLRFESVNIRECSDRLVIYDADDPIDATRLEELSCRNTVDKGRLLHTTNAGGYVTIRYYTYNNKQIASDFRLVLTAVSKYSDSVSCGFRCANNYCISRDLNCDSDHINHCGDNSDELNCLSHTSGDGDRSETRDFLGMGITVTIIIILSVLFVGGVCVCSIALFVCKRNHVPQPVLETAAPPTTRTSQGDGMSSSDATSSSARSHTAYTPVLTDFSNVVPPSSRIFHGKSMSLSGAAGPSPMLSKHCEPLPQGYPSIYPVPGTPRLPDANHSHFGTPTRSFGGTTYPSIDPSKKLLYF